jgi:uncharacterized protein (UPF0548 family)
MNVGGLRLGRLADDGRAKLLHDAQEATVTYDHVGSTLDPLRWHPPAVRSHHVEVGQDSAAFDAARTAVQTWVPQRALGAGITPAEQRVALDETVVLVLRRGPMFVVAPTRIVAVIDEPRRFAFAYGTLPGHPERGEEGFMVEWLPDGAVRTTIRVQAVPASLAARAVAPFIGWLQNVALRRYLRAISDYVATQAEHDGMGQR